jgi:hypothetical protein
MPVRAQSQPAGQQQRRSRSERDPAGDDRERQQRRGPNQHPADHHHCDRTHQRREFLHARSARGCAFVAVFGDERVMRGGQRVQPV